MKRSDVHEAVQAVAAEIVEYGETPELLEVLSLSRSKGKPRKACSEAGKRLWHELQFIDAMRQQDRLLAMGLHSKDPRVLNVAWDAARDVKDRVLGKATERIQIAQAVRVEVTGIDLGQLPGGGDPQSGQEGEPPSGGEG